MREYLAYKDDLPGSRRARCLGCGQRVVAGRDPHVFLGGKRDGSLLLVWDTEPQFCYATDVDRIYTEPEMFVLGIAHRECTPLARSRLEAQQVPLPDELPQLLTGEDVGDLPRMHLPPGSGRCPFCGESDVSEEHVFPKWVSRELTALGSLRLTTEYGPRRLRSVGITAPACPTCNNRWLSVLEKDVQPVLAPLIRGEERSLALKEQCLVAAWAAKTAFMLDLASGDPIIPVGFYYRFRQLRTALASQAVWMAAYSGSNAIWAERCLLRVGIGAEEPPNAVVTTFNVFRVIFQVVGHFTNAGATINDARLLSAGLWSIWPPRADSIDWPRDRLAFDDKALSDLSASING